MNRTRLWSVTRRLLTESALPLLAATLYTVCFHWADDAFSWREVSRTFGSAFFFLMYFAAAFLRTAKHVDDKEYQEELRGLITSLREVVGTGGDAARTAPDQPSLGISDPVAQALVRDAEAARLAGSDYSAVLTLAVALEHALRDLALRRGVDGADKMPMMRLMNAIDLNPDLAGNIRALWKARNALVHMRSDRAEAMSELPVVYDALHGALVALSQVDDR